MVVLVLQPKGYAASLIYTPSDRTSNLLGADESDWQDEETGLEDNEYFDEDDLDLTQDELAVIGSMGWGSRTH